MCDMCNGKTENEVLLDLGEKIRRNGYVLQGVDGGHAEPSWVYTIGLLDHLDHPELIVAGPEVELPAAIIIDAITRVEAGYPIVGGDAVHIDDLTFRAVDVHPRQFHSSTFAMWHHYYDALGSPPDEPSAVQLLCPPSLFCREHGVGVATLRLDDPGIVLAYPRPPRDVRRAKAQQRRRRRQRPSNGRGRR